jgi:hypothetical protein
VTDTSDRHLQKQPWSSISTERGITIACNPLSRNENASIHTNLELCSNIVHLSRPQSEKSFINSIGDEIHNRPPKKLQYKQLICFQELHLPHFFADKNRWFFDLLSSWIAKYPIHQTFQCFQQTLWCDQIILSFLYLDGKKCYSETKLWRRENYVAPFNQDH